MVATASGQQNPSQPPLPEESVVEEEAGEIPESLSVSSSRIFQFLQLSEEGFKGISSTKVESRDIILLDSSAIMP
ncbi:MAG: hypothetical protein ABIR00_06380 [Nitrosospira sp.]